MGFCGDGIWKKDGSANAYMPAFTVVCAHSTAAINREIEKICKDHDIPHIPQVDVTPATVRAYELATSGDVGGMKEAKTEFDHWEENANTDTLTELTADSTHRSDKSPKHNLAYAAIMLGLYMLGRHLDDLNELRAKYGHKTLLKCVKACLMRREAARGGGG